MEGDGGCTVTTLPSPVLYYKFQDKGLNHFNLQEFITSYVS